MNSLVFSLNEADVCWLTRPRHQVCGWVGGCFVALSCLAHATFHFRARNNVSMYVIPACVEISVLPVRVL